MLAEQYKTLMSKINAALSEPLTPVDQAVYEESKDIITSFYNSHTETEPVVEERDSLVPSTGKPGIDNSEKIAALEARNKEIDARIAEIDNEIAYL